MNRIDPQTRRLIPVAGILIIAAVVIGVQLLTVVTLAALWSVPAPRLTVWELIGLWGQGAPSKVTGIPGTDVWHWVFIALVLAILVAAGVLLAVFSHRRRVNPENLQGLATASEVRKHAGAAQLVSRARTLRPSLAKSAPEDAGYFIGTYRGQDVWASVEDPMILVGPSRSGKGWYYVLRTIVNAPGAVVATSCKADNVRWTIGPRQTGARPVYVFDPLEKARGVGHALRWNPLTGCEGQRTLERRMSYLVPGDAFSGNTQNGGHWDTLGYAIATGLFHAAALDGKTVHTIWTWVLDKAAARAAVSIIRQHPDGIQEHANFLDSVLTQAPEKRDSEWNTVRTALAYLQSPEVRAWLTPKESETFDVFDFLMDKGTLYLLGSEQGMNGFEKVIGALLGEIDYVADEIAAGSLHNRLDPPVTFVLDEVANFKISTLPTLISAGGGVGKVTVAVFQSKSQMGEWGQSAERAMWDSASLKLVLPGGSDDAELRALSNLVGEIEEDRLQESFSDSGTSRSVSTQDRAVLTATKIRELKVGYGLLFHRSMKPIIVKMPAFNTVAGFDAHAAAADDVAAGMATASVYADRIRARQEKANQ